MSDQSTTAAASDPITAGDSRPRDVSLVQRMVALLKLEQVSADVFRFPGMTTEPRRIFGGQFVGQAVAAATQTIEPGRRMNSLHAYFIRSGVTTAQLDFRVARDADGSNVSFRRILVTQEDKPLLSLSAAFQAAHAEGLKHEIAMPDVPPPESLEDDYRRTAVLEGLSDEARSVIQRASPFEFRSPNPDQRYGRGPTQAYQQFWFRAAAPFEGDQAFHRTVLAYASDMMLLGTALMPHGMRWFDGQARVASLDHALWIHNDVTMSDWLLYAQESPWSGDGRSLNRGHIFDRAGCLVATVAQEGSLRRQASARTSA